MHTITSQLYVGKTHLPIPTSGALKQNDALHHVAPSSHAASQNSQAALGAVPIEAVYKADVLDFIITGPNYSSEKIFT